MSSKLEFVNKLFWFNHTAIYKGIFGKNDRIGVSDKNLIQIELFGLLHEWFQSFSLSLIFFKHFVYYFTPEFRF